MTLEELHEETGTPLVDVPGGRLPLHHGDPAGELTAGLSAVGLVDRSNRGRLRISGSERCDYLQRISAQDFRSLAPPSGVRAALLERTGKIVDVISAHAFDDHLLLFTSAALRQATMDWIGRFIFRAEVEVRDVVKDTGHLLLVGPRSGSVAVSLAGEAASRLQPYETMAMGSRPETLLIRGGPEAWGVFHLLGPAATMADLWSQVLEEGAGSDLRPVGEQAYQALRVLAGVPQGGTEIDARTNPMELGLADSYSLDKGCYTGQEVLAKMATHQSVKRALVGLELGEGSVSEVGTALHRDRQVVGRVTSAVRLPGSERRVALALVGRPHAEPGTMLCSAGGAKARVVTLPFQPPEKGDRLP